MNLFSKLYQMPCPVEENFSYYLDRLRDRVMGREVTYCDRAFLSEGHLARWSE